MIRAGTFRNTSNNHMIPETEGAATWWKVLIESNERNKQNELNCLILTLCFPGNIYNSKYIEKCELSWAMPVTQAALLSYSIHDQLLPKERQIFTIKPKRNNQCQRLQKTGISVDDSGRKTSLLLHKPGHRCQDCPCTYCANCDTPSESAGICSSTTFTLKSLLSYVANSLPF